VSQEDGKVDLQGREGVDGRCGGEACLHCAKASIKVARNHAEIRKSQKK